MALSTQFKRVLAAAFLVLALAAAAGAFAVGFTHALTQSLDDPASVPLLRLAALDRLDQSLGYGGYLKVYREFLQTGAGNAENELRGLADTAEASLATYMKASLTEDGRDRAASLRSLAAPFRRTALFGADAARQPVTGLPPLPDMERAYAALKIDIGKATLMAERDRIDRVAGAFVWAQTMSVAALWLIAAILFALAWFLHERLLTPIEILRSSVNGAAAGAIGEPVWGIGRDDEIGTLARAAERLRQAAVTAGRERSMKTSARLADGAERLEDDLAKVAGAAMEAQARIEAASARAAKASQTAIEVAGLAAEGSVRFAQRAEQTFELASAQTNAVMGALMAAVTKLADTADRLEQAPPEAGATSEAATETGPFVAHRMTESVRLAHSAGKDDGEAVVEDLIADLGALERFAKDRKDIAGDKAVAMTSALIEAIDRLNAVAGRISKSADDPKLRAAG